MTRFSIVRLDEEHLDEVCEDIRYQVENGIADCALFMVKLEALGDPPYHTAEDACARLDKHIAKLGEMGLPFGILVQSTVGHGFVLGKDNVFPHVVAFDDGDVKHIACPNGDAFGDYIEEQMAVLASRHPRVILVDDDFRLLYHFARGCACPMHMKRFHELSGTDLSREELRAIVGEGRDEGDRLWNAFAETQRESLLKAARRMRRGIDRVDPSIWVGHCSSISIEWTDEIADILAGEGNPRLIRLNTPNYCASSGRELSRLAYRAAYGVNTLQKPGAVLLAETDTCPHNRYATSASMMHATFVTDLLEGANGAKHWITKLDDFAPQSGVAYRKILRKYDGFYRELARIVPTLTFEGCRIPLPEKHRYTFAHTGFYEDFSGWSTKCLERLGFPLYFSARRGGVVFLDGGIPQNLSDGELRAALSGPCVLSSDAAETLILHGFGEYVGVSVKPFSGFIGYEKTREGNVGVQFKAKELVPAKGAVADSVNCVKDGGGERELFPACVVFQNALGGTVITFCGTPNYEWFHYTQAFSFLHPVRKAQLGRLLAPFGVLDTYYPDDGEVYVKVAKTQDGETFVAMTNLGTDTEDETVLSVREKAAAVRMLQPDGSISSVPFRQEKDRLVVSAPLVPLHASILLIK